MESTTRPLTIPIVYKNDYEINTDQIQLWENRH